MAPNDDAKRKSGLTIAQVKFKQAMKDSDAEDRSAPIAVEISSQLFNHVDAVLQQNSPINIQKCTEWIVKHVAPSKARITTLGAYLIAVSKSVVVDQSTPALAKKAARNRMDILLIVNDALHADKFHRRDTTKQSILGTACQDFVPDLIELAAACITDKGSQLEVKLKAIVNYWAVNKLLSPEGLKACQHKADEALSVAQGRKRNYVLPEYHGDRNARWHDLPASYMLEPIIKHPNRPIHESQIRIRKLDKKPVSPHVRALLDNYFENIDLKYLPTGDNPTGETTKYRLSLDPMGQLVKQDKETGETATVANGYGWSPKFCQDIQNFTVPETIKIAREDIERMEDMKVSPHGPSRRESESRGFVEPRPTRSRPCCRSRLSTRRHFHRSTCQASSKASSRCQCRHSVFLLLHHRSSKDVVASFPLPRPPTSTVCGSLLPTRTCHRTVRNKATRVANNLVTTTEARVEIGAATNSDTRAATSMVPTSVPVTMASMVRTVADTKVDVVMEVDSAVATTATGEAGGATDEAGDTERRHILQRTLRVMARTKRKRNSLRTNTNKRSRYDDSSPSEAGSTSDTLWAAECILDEHVVRGVRKYYIQWQGIDPKTGKTWEPTWEPEENANDLLVAHWTQEKARDLAEVDQQSQGSDSRHSEGQQEAQAQASRRIRNPRVIDSSPEPTDRSSEATSPLSIRADPERLPSAAVSAARASPRIQIARRGDSLERNNYVRFTQTPSSQPAPTPEPTQDTNLDSSQLFAARPRPHLSDIVPDSQSSSGEGSFVPTTQRTEDIGQQSTDSNDSRVEEDLAEDSGLLELIEEAAQHALSPARSIPETIPETIPDTTIADSQSQRQRPETESQGAPNTLEFIHISSQLEHESSPELEDTVHGQQSEIDQSAAQDEFQGGDTDEVGVPQVDHITYEPRPTQSAREIISDRVGGTLGEHPRLEPAATDSTRNASTEVVGTDEVTISRNKPSTLVENSQSHHTERPNVASDTQVLAGSSDDPSQRQGFQQISVCDSQPILIEHSALEDNEQFPFQSQQPFLHSQPSESVSCIKVSEQLPQACATLVLPGRVLAGVSVPSESNPAPAPDPPHPSVQASTTIHHQDHNDPLVELLEPEAAHSASPSGQLQEELSLRDQLLHASSSPERVQNAQVVPLEADLSTQEDTSESIRTTIEEEVAHRASSESRHDSSQESPERPSRSLNNEASPVLYPPSYSLQTQESRLPSRPCTPVPTSSLSIMAGEEPAIAEAITLSEPIVPVPRSPTSDEMEVSDADDEDSESLFNDDLQLVDQEFIVPLFIQGRQRDTYAQYITAKKDLLEPFLKDRHSLNSVEEVKNILSQLRAIETHMDLVFAEAESNVLNGEASATQAEHAARFGLENSTKFRFLSALFNDLRHCEPQKHVVLVTESDNETLFHILETFCKTTYINYTMPGKDRKANLKEVVGNLLVTIIPSDASPTIHVPDMIICLDGVQDAAQIRKKSWAKSPNCDVVPVLHLVIPRTVGHIERYITSGLDRLDHMHTVLASLAHVHPDIGKAIDERTLRDVHCASLVADWIKNRMEGADWPLSSIGSVKDVIEYQTQQTSTDIPMSERTKRPLDEEDLDPAKRMRFTPQPQTVPASAVGKEYEVTHISDSMPGTAAYDSDLRTQLAHAKEGLREEREAHRAGQRDFDQHKDMWDKQQTVHEDLASEHRRVKRRLQDAEDKVETLTRNNATLTERLTARTTEMREVKEKLKEQRETALLDPNAQLQEIAKLRNQLDEANDKTEQAVKKAAAAEQMLDYMRESLQDARSTASTSTARVEELEAQQVTLSKAASGEATKRKSMHIERSYEEQQQRVKRLETELSITKRTLMTKDEEIARLKSMGGRPGVGTRGTSATPQPKTRSRAASPTFPGGRIANLRNS
ncbi:hypothetical protein BKA58DRAFT_329969 [Alternaria rosae]|uniref:uncharacterized protein n=1 Tax=Alternaria rosae TaxID=1187941 RepID=UPI001E8E94A0|nr:uncharacterized protein BKA58DRAFT_329969 [Alternaria rosae]KAH6882896.1 hypothetical protein BKA58DRAFT_329969 [Alternaria rosae]